MDLGVNFLFKNFNFSYFIVTFIKSLIIVITIVITTFFVMSDKIKDKVTLLADKHIINIMAKKYKVYHLLY